MLPTTFAIIYLIQLSRASLAQVHTNLPKVNTLYVPIGTLYPRSDFAGVIIDLNVQDAIKRGTAALQLTDSFLTHHVKKLLPKEWTGKYRSYQFLSLNRRKVGQNLAILKADLYQIQEQYRIPQPPKESSAPSHKRSKRGINLDIEFDVNKCLSTVIKGVVSLFSAPKSLDKIQKSVTKLALRTSRLESKFHNFTSRLELIVKWMKQDFNTDVDQLHMVDSINAALNIANEAIMEILDSITPLVQGQLTHNLLDPLMAHHLINKTQDLADTFNLQVAINQPVDILKCSVTTFATEHAWYALLSIPLVHREEAMVAYQFVNIPFFHDNQAVQWDFREGIVASKSGLYPKIENVFVPMEEVNELCEQFNNNYLCHKRINHYPTCQISLINNATTHCSLIPAIPKVRYSFGSFSYLFFQKHTKSLVKCPNPIYAFNRTGPRYDESHPDYYGLVDVGELSDCTITTTQFTLLPRAPAKGQSALENKIKPLFLIDNQLIKVLVEFDQREQEENNQDPNPWHQMEIESNYKNDIRIFGSHTILVHSILMFLILLFMFMLLSICVMNFLHYTPKFLQDHATSVKGSALSLHAPQNQDDPACGGQEDFTDEAERPVKINV